MQIINCYLSFARDSIATFKRAIGLVYKASPGLLRWSVTLQILNAFLPFGVFYAIKRIIDELVVGVKLDVFNERDILIAVAALGVLWMANGLLSSATSRVEGLLQLKFSDYISGLVQYKSNRTDLAFYENPDMQDTFHRAQREAIYRPYQVVQSMMTLIQSGVFLVLVAAFLITLNPWLVLLMIGAGLPGLFVKLKIANKQYGLERSITQADRKSWYLHHILTGAEAAKELRLYRFGSRLMNQYKSIRDRIYRDRLGIFNMRAKYEVLGKMAEVIALSLGVLWASMQALAGALPIGSLVMYLQAFQRGQGQYRSSMNALAQLYSHRLFLTNLFEFFDIKQTVVTPRPHASMPVEVKEGFRLENVWFSYPGSKTDVVRGVNLSIEPGEKVALVGLNGSGKSTLVKLLARFYDPDRGILSVDGVDARSAKIGDYREKISIAFQESLRYPFTVRKNIRMGNLRRPYNEAEVIAAAKASGAHDFIEKLPFGYSTTLGTAFQGGHELSGGQWQQIALARALYRQSDLLILDEPLSQVDALKEQDFMEYLLSRKNPQSVLFVTHRLSHLRRADRIVVMDEGRIVEEGPFEVLMAMGGLFCEMFSRQNMLRGVHV
jgi:ATP-binding cassette, subfamily B, bacterial